MTEEDYKNKFREPSKGATENSQEFKGEKEAYSRAGRALTLALDIRKFEIELYWKRATYFWGFIAAAFAGYAITYKTVSDHEPWLNLLFSSLGLIFSWAWFLVNRGSKFWQQNWEGHVDLLEDITLGPLYKTLAIDVDQKCFLVAAGRFSVSKINQLLSFFVTLIWIILYFQATLLITATSGFNYLEIIIAAFTPFSFWLIWYLGRSANEKTNINLESQKDNNTHTVSAGIEWDIYNKESLNSYLSHDRREVIAQKALDIAEKNVGPHHPDVAISLDILADIYKSMGGDCYHTRELLGDFTNAEPPETHLKAEEFYKRSLTIRENTFGLENINVANSLDRIAILYTSIGDHYCKNIYQLDDEFISYPINYYLKAKELFKRSLTIKENIFGPDHVEVATSLDNLAITYKSIWSFNQKYREKTLNEQSSTRQNDNYIKEKSIDDYFKAEVFYKRSLTIQENTYGTESIQLLEILRKLSSLYKSKGDKYNTDRFDMRMLTVSQKDYIEGLKENLGPDHPDVAKNLAYLAQIYCAQNDYAKAEFFYIRSLEILEKAPNPDHPDVETTLEQLAALYRVTKRESEAADIEQLATHIHAMKK